MYQGCCLIFLLTLWSTKIKMNPTIPNIAARDNMILCAWNQPPPLTILPSPSATFLSTAALLILNSFITSAKSYVIKRKLMVAYPRGAKKHQARNIHIAWAYTSSGFFGTSVWIIVGAANKSIFLFMIQEMNFSLTPRVKLLFQLQFITKDWHFRLSDHE